MNTLAHARLVDDDPDTGTLSTRLIDAAAGLETKLSTSERRIQVLTRQLHHAYTRLDRTRRAVRTIRKSHRNDSHHRTSVLMRRLLADLDTPLDPADDTTHLVRPVSILK